MADIGQLTERGYALKKEIEELDKKSKELGENLSAIQNQIMEEMKNQGMSSFKHAHCMVILNTRFTVKQPVTPDEKQKFFDYLRERKIFEDMVSVNSMRLNAWFKEEMEVAKQKGDFGFKVPGLPEPSSLEYITFRKV